MFKRAVVFVLSMLVFSLFAATVFGADLGKFSNYSADVETRMSQGTFTSKMFFKDTKVRIESSQGGHNSISIMRPDRKVMWIVMPEQKSYMEMPLDLSQQDIQAKLHDPSIKIDKEFIANEVVDRHPAKKYHMTITTDGKKEKSGYIWEATDLNNFPVKYESEDRKTTTVWKNIKTGGVSDSVFEAPAGFKKMDMPMMPQGMGSPKKSRR